MRDEIIAALSAIELQSSSAFEVVSKEPTNKFSGYPAATVLPANVGAEHLTVAHNERAYGFNVFVFYQLGREGDWTTAVDNSLDLVDACMDALDKTIDLNGTADDLRAVSLDWDVQEITSDVTAIVAVMNVIAIKSINVRL